MVKFTNFLLTITASFILFNVSAQDFPPPRNLQLDTLTLVATWEPPRRVLLDEHFEAGVFPPANWQDTTQGMGWFATTDGSSAELTIPPHTTYAAVNNDLAGAGNNGCCDYLITPEVDLTQASSYTLSFNSFFRGWDAETATVEISTDGGNTWSILLEVLPHFTWATLTIDLSPYSGPAGSQQVQLAFKASDNGSAGATGWAIDDVLVMSEELQVNGYVMFYDGTEVSQTADTFIAFNPSSFPLGFPPNFCISAWYDFGLSEGVCANFPAYYLKPPQNLEAVINGSTTSIIAILNWQSPSANLLSYNIYRNNSFLVNVAGTATVYWDILAAPGTYCYDVSAVYDLTDLGFPGQIGESQLEGPACVENSLAHYLPFEENWATGQFDINLWTAGENWVMDGGNGNSAPSAKFSSLPTLTNYSSKLVSFHMYSGAGKTATPYCVWLSFDYLLDDISASGTEKLTIEIENGDTWTTLKEFTNTGDVSWTTEKININPFAINIPFRIRFNVNGANSEMISHWLVDNIKIYHEYSFIPVANLSAENTGNPQQNDIQLSWDVPQWEDFTKLIQDDNNWETVLNINPGYSGWLGNKFTSGAGELRSVDIMWLNNNTDNPVVLDIFDANHALIGSSESFVPVPGNWQTITIPALNVEGDFYTMVRFDGQSGKKDFLGMDITAPTGRPNNGWFFDGVNWSQMDAFGYPECVFLIRATLSVHKNCEDGDSHSKSKSLNSAGNNNLDSRNRNSIKSATGYAGLSHYDLYRREYTIPVAGQDSLLTEWQKISSPTTNSFLDQNLDLKCYQYYVEAMYNEGSSGPSEIAEECFFVGMDDLQTTSAKLYPNPASDFLTIEINIPIDNIAVYNSTGVLVEEINLSVVSENSLEKKIRLDVSNFPTGIYSLKFTTSKGESFSRKFIKM